MPKPFRIYLRALEIEDYKTSVNWRRDDELWNSVVGRRYYVSESYEREWVQKRANGMPNSEAFAICLRENNTYIGNGYLNNIDLFNRCCEIGRLIGDPACRGIGLGSEITMLLLRHAFLELGLERVYSWQLPTNIASAKSKEKAGFRHEGIARKAAMKGGQLVDLELVACLREDFLPILEKWMEP